MEPDAMVRAGLLAILELGLGDRGAEVDVPQHGRFGLIGLAPRQIAQEPALGDAPAVIVDRGVPEVPVDREPERPPQLLERLLVLDRQPVAQLDEVRAARCAAVGRRARPAP